MTDFMAYRGPDGLEIWSDGEMGLGHADLRTGDDRANYRQPAVLDSFWIAADAHLDSKTELTNKIEQTGRQIEPFVSDSMLILHAYAAWGSKCVDHLRGDFSFGIWDRASKTLFCARDHFGIKPFYYAVLGDLFLFSNTLNCLRQHPSITKELNESTIGDFLLFGLNYNKGTTYFRDIQRLPPAHSITVSRESLQTRRYWQPPSEARIRYSRTEDYVDRFNELLRSAVADRLPPDRVGIFLSGGLDSGAVATVAKEISTSCGNRPQISSYTVGYEYLIPDDESVHARVLANYLGIPNTYLALDDIELFDKCDDAAYRFPEPVDNPLAAGLIEQFHMIVPESRVVLSGEGPDNLMYFQMWPYLRELQRNRQWSRLVKEAAWFLWARPLPWLGAARRIQALFAKAGEGGEMPCWIDDKFAKRAMLAKRWKECSNLQMPAERHLSRPKAHASMLLPQWADMFELSDPGVTHQLVETRYPFLDLRMVDYLLAIPAFPWIYKKIILRTAMAARLPESLRLRPKTPLSADPLARKLRHGRNSWRRDRRLVGQICEFVDPAMLERFHARIGTEQFRPYCLDVWLKGVV